jgi:hypothetical protein
MNDPRVSRYWQLVGIVGDKPELAAAGAPTYESMRWLVQALGGALE